MRTIVTTPNLHKVHHSQVVADSNMNFATISTIWDKLFGTYKSYPTATVRDIRLGVQDAATVRLPNLILI